MNGPWRIPVVAMLALTLVLAACGGDAGGGDGGGGGDDLPERASASVEDAEGTTYPLAPGRYRLSYRAPGCQQLVISIQGVDHEFSYEQQQRAFVSFINDLPGGQYTIDVLSECDEWTVELSQF